MMLDLARDLIAEEMASFGAARRASDRLAAWRALERAHIVAQPYFGLHLASHWTMLSYALRERDFKEAGGQCLRLALVPLGAITGRLPPVILAGRMLAPSADANPQASGSMDDQS